MTSCVNSCVNKSFSTIKLWFFVLVLCNLCYCVTEEYRAWIACEAAALLFLFSQGVETKLSKREEEEKKKLGVHHFCPSSTKQRFKNNLVSGNGFFFFLHFYSIKKEQLRLRSEPFKCGCGQCSCCHFYKISYPSLKLIELLTLKFTLIEMLTVINPHLLLIYKLWVLASSSR